MAKPSLIDDVTEQAPDVALDVPAAIMDEAGKGMLKDAPRVTRYVLKRIPGAPGFIYDAANFATSRDKLRTGLGIAGGVVGGFAGEALGGPVGGIAGSAAGEAGTQWVYDHRDEIAWQAAKTAQWMKDRTAQVANRFEYGFDQGMPPFSTPLR